MDRIKNQIVSKLQASFVGAHIIVENESHMHSVPPNSETHFKVVLVSDEFEGVPRVRRHQRIYELLDNELKKEDVHALALKLFTLPEYDKLNPGVLSSPQCASKSK